jgi:Rrf2 family protein
MHLSQTIEYALRATVWLAENPGIPQTTQQIADACKAPPSYLAKVMQSLVRGGVISAQRGPGGGFLLEGDLESLTLLDVVNAIEPIQRVRGCPLEIPGHDVELCPLHKVLDRALQACHDVLARHRIADMVNKGCFSRPLAVASRGVVDGSSSKQEHAKNRLG